MTPASEITAAVKAYILSEFLEGESPDSIQGTTPLISSGVLDSIGTVKLVSFLEEKYGIELEAHEINVDLLNTLDDIAKLVMEKQKA